jgi:hypothetical protein
VFGISLSQDSTVDVILAYRLLEIANGGRVQEALDFNGDALTTFLRTDCHALRTEINEQILPSLRDGQGVMCNRPSV